MKGQIDRRETVRTDRINSMYNKQKLILPSFSSPAHKHTFYCILSVIIYSAILSYVKRRAYHIPCSVSPPPSPRGVSWWLVLSRAPVWNLTHNWLWSMHYDQATHPSASQPLYLAIYSSIYLFICFHLSQTIYLFICRPINQESKNTCIYVSIRVSACLTIYKSTIR